MNATSPAPVLNPLPLAAPTHEHGWSTQSAHRTSEGTVVYVRCTQCGASRVELHRPTETWGSSRALSREVGGIRAT